MPTTTTMLPVRGDEATRKAVRKLAGDQGVDMADVVYEALRSQYGDEFESSIAFFRAKNGRKNARIGVKVTE